MRNLRRESERSFFTLYKGTTLAFGAEVIVLNENVEVYVDKGLDEQMILEIVAASGNAGVQPVPEKVTHKVKVARNAGTGKFATKASALANASETVVETIER